eukprot:s1424_g13.t1
MSRCDNGPAKRICTLGFASGHCSRKQAARAPVFRLGSCCGWASEDIMGANKVVQKSKEAKMKAAMAGGKSRKKKWAKGKVKEKLANLVMFDKATYDKMLKEIPKARLITPSVVSERLKVNGSVARQAIRHLEVQQADDLHTQDWRRRGLSTERWPEPKLKKIRTTELHGTRFFLSTKLAKVVAGTGRTEFRAGARAVPNFSDSTRPETMAEEEPEAECIDARLCVKEESDVFVEAFSYICRLVNIIRPKKMLYMAIDGCAPRAKMNQQRSRRFRAANDAREARELAQEMGEVVSGPHFDSNCITPGTEFMAKLTEHLRFFICKKIQEDPAWQRFTVVLSGPETPGEGEHKIMDYIRKAKAQPDHDPNTRHCLYGLDADLIMLSLASHEPHFALLREEVLFGRRETKTTEQRILIAKDRFQLLHISLLREYLDIEFKPHDVKFEYNLERIIDDFILFCVLIGNDFLPHLPFAEIGENGLDDLFRIYKDHLASASNSPWLTKNCGEVDFKQFAKFIKKYGELEDSHLQAACDEQNFVLGKQRLVGPADAPTPAEYTLDLPQPPGTSEEAREQWYDIKFGMDLTKYEGTQKQRGLFQSYLEGLHWVLRYYFRGPDQASWSWYYPFYHAPMAVDLANYDQLGHPEISLEIGQVFKPFQQLMAVLPDSSKTLLPECYQWLFGSNSPVANFYPRKFVVDMDGVKTPWGGMTLIPFIDPTGLLSAMEQAYGRGPALSPAEIKRDEFRGAHSFQYDMKAGVFVQSTVPRKYSHIQKCPVRINEFKHPELPAHCEHFPNYLLPGLRTKEMGFPTLHLHPLTTSFQVGVKVFQFEARNLSLYLHARPTGAFEPDEEAIQHALTSSAAIDYP